jgi:hypothetical protein
VGDRAGAHGRRRRGQRDGRLLSYGAVVARTM